MSASLCCRNNLSLSYQHYQGLMLAKLNELAYKINLSHAEYRVMGVIIGFWNKNCFKSYPSIRIISAYARMSHSTVLKSLKNLADLELIYIIDDWKFGRHSYYINPQKFLFEEKKITSTLRVTPQSSSCGNKHINNKKILTIKNHKSFDIISKVNTYDDNFLQESVKNNYTIEKKIRRAKRGFLYINHPLCVYQKEIKFKNTRFKEKNDILLSFEN